MPKYRKKPVVIEAIQFDGTLQSVDGFMPYDAFEYRPSYHMPTGSAPSSLTIQTLEGPMTANHWDYIIKGVNGEFYPCKPDIFAKTYEQVNEPACTAPQDPDHELTEDEVATLASNGSLCDCTWVELDGTEHPIEEGDLVDFGTALHLMELGERVQREGWNGKGMFVYIVPAASYPAQRNAKGVLVGDYPNDMVPYSAYIALKTASGEVVPWTISQSDALATDWCLA